MAKAATPRTFSLGISTMDEFTDIVEPVMQFRWSGPRDDEAFGLAHKFFLVVSRITALMDKTKPLPVLQLLWLGLFMGKLQVEVPGVHCGIIIFLDRQQAVALTGDGAYDALALKLSDVGFAMGIPGTQIAKGTADIVPLDDVFQQICNFPAC